MRIVYRLSLQIVLVANFAVVAKTCALELELLLIFLKVQMVFKVFLCIFEISGRSLQEMCLTLVDEGCRQL